MKTAFTPCNLSVQQTARAVRFFSVTYVCVFRVAFIRSLVFFALSAADFSVPQGACRVLQ